MRSEKHQEPSAESWSDQELVERLRRDEATAVREFYDRFTAVLLKVARLAHLQPELRYDIAIDFLTDSALRLMQPTVAIPANLPGYLVAAFRHRLANDRRAAKRRVAASTAAAGTGDGERVVRELCSEASIRDSAGPAYEAPPLSPVLERLSDVINAGISDTERQMLRWISASIPQRLIAEWLGITHNAARVRVLRLRERLIDTALRGDTAWSPKERQELYEFFRRSGLGERARRAFTSAREDGTEPSRPPGGRNSPREDQ